MLREHIRSHLPYDVCTFGYVVVVVGFEVGVCKNDERQE
jgi:hypothetical protein